MTKTNICRCCLEESKEYHEIFSNQNRHCKIAQILGQHFWFKITLEDEYSKLICIKCWTIVQQFHSFYLFIQQIHAKSFGGLAITNRNGDLDDQKDDNIPKRLGNSLLPAEDDTRSSNDCQHDADDTPSTIIVTDHNSELSKKRKKSHVTATTDECETEALRKAIETAEEDAKILDFFKFDCQLCQGMFPNFKELRQHYRRDHDIKRGYVSCCKKKFTHRCELLEHMNWHTDPNAFKCNICNKTYHDQYALKMHMHHHAPDEEKILTCDVCCKSYSIKYHLLQHLRSTHFPEEQKIHNCNECGKKFGLNSVLQAHIRTVHRNAYAHVCHICAKVFKGKQACKQHMLAHSSAPKVQCTICGAWLKNDSSLRCHVQRSHTEQPLSCPMCSKILPNKHALQNHTKYIHDNERLHKCSLCDRTFKQKIGLKEHMATHTGSILYTCPYCPKTFNSNANKHSHRKRAHPREWLRDRRCGPKFVIQE